MTGGTFTAPDGCRLAFDDEGEGLPVLWQHGLGADRAQPAEVFPAGRGFRRITLECRGHGGSALGDPDQLSIDRFAADALVLLDHLGVEQAVVGGISLGAAIALRLGVLHPERVRALVLARPAWVSEAAPETLSAYVEVARLLDAYGPEDGARRFEDSPVLAALEAASPDNAASLRAFFGRRDPASTVALLTRIPKDGPGVDADHIAALKMPTLVVANGEDHVHPVAYAERLARLIPGAELVIIPSKTVDRGAYVAGFRGALAGFLGRTQVA